MNALRSHTHLHRELVPWRPASRCARRLRVPASISAFHRGGRGAHQQPWDAGHGTGSQHHPVAPQVRSDHLPATRRRGPGWKGRRIRGPRLGEDLGQLFNLGTPRGGRLLRATRSGHRFPALASGLRAASLGGQPGAAPRMGEAPLSAGPALPAGPPTRPVRPYPQTRLPGPARYVRTSPAARPTTVPGPSVRPRSRARAPGARRRWRVMTSYGPPAPDWPRPPHQTAGGRARGRGGGAQRPRPQPSSSHHVTWRRRPPYKLRRAPGAAGLTPGCTVREVFAGEPRGRS